jgi:hypothetical protein
MLCKTSNLIGKKSKRVGCSELLVEKCKRIFSFLTFKIKGTNTTKISAVIDKNVSKVTYLTYIVSNIMK